MLKRLIKVKRRKGFVFENQLELATQRPTMESLGPITRLYHCRSFFIFLLSLITFVTFTFLSPNMNFARWNNFSTMMKIMPEFGIPTLGMALLLISGEFDLSIGSIFAFCAMVAAWSYYHWGLHPILGLLLAMGVGALLGLINGLIVTKTKVSSLIVTLGTMWVYRGLLFMITGGFPVYYHPERTFPLYYKLLVGNLGPAPAQMVWMIGLTALLYVLLEHTRLGNWIFSTGSNKEAARFMGINTDKVKIICFMITGTLSALAGVMQSCRLHGAYTVQGQMLNLRAIAAAVVGGNSIFGGVGTVPGAFFGALIIQFLDSGFLAIGLSMFHFYVALGSTLIAVVFANLWLRSRRTLRYQAK